MGVEQAVVAAAVAAAAASPEPATNLGYFQGRRLAEAPTTLLRSRICNAARSGFGLKWAAASPQTVNRWEARDSQLKRDRERERECSSTPTHPPHPLKEQTRTKIRLI